MRSTGVLLIVCLLVCALASRAVAQTPEARAESDTLFEDAKTLMAAGNFAEACPKLAESMKLVPRLGVQLNLAECHEKQGLTATAWGEWRTASSMANKEGDPRGKFAMDRANTLEKSLARVRVKVAPGEPAGFVVKRDGEVLDAPFFGSAIPVNPGDHVVEASAPGVASFSKKVTATDANTIEVDVPLLVAEASSAPPIVVAPPPREQTESGRSRKWLGVVVGASGVALAGTGIVLGLAANSSYKTTVRNHCTDGATLMCDPTGVDDVNGAFRLAGAGTVVGLIGAAAIAGGVVLYLTAPSGKRDAHALRVVPQGAGLAVAGGF